MKKLMVFLLAAALAASLPLAGSAAKRLTPEELTRSRCAMLWVGGKKVGDMMVGADAKMQFQFMDRALATEIYNNPNAYPEAFAENVGYLDKASRAKCNLVLLIYRANNSWTFDPSLLTVNGQPVERKRIFASLLSKEMGRISGDTEDSVPFGIPRADSKPGAKIVFGYGGAEVEFTVPPAK